MNDHYILFFQLMVSLVHMLCDYSCHGGLIVPFCRPIHM
jgi:hypothetical protein